MGKKRETYGSITRKLNALLEKQEQERQRMARVMAEVLLTDRVAAQIGDYTDTDLRKVMRLLSEYLYDCIDQVENDRRCRYRNETEEKRLPEAVSSEGSDKHRIPDTAVVQ